MTDLRVGFLGGGHITSVLRRAVDETRPYRVVGTFGRDDTVPARGEVDVVVEAATQRAVRERVPGLLADGIDVIRPPAPEKGNRLMLTLAIVAGGLAIALAAVIVVAINTNVFG